nr:glycosyltransferase [Salinarchaeum laminariae]
MTAAAGPADTEESTDNADTATTNDTDAADTTMRVLNLVTNDRARFFVQQVDALEARGVESTTITVPNDHGPDSNRSVVDYLRLLPTTIRESFGEYDLVHANYGLTAPAALAQPNLPVVVSLWGSDLLGRYGPITSRCAARADEVVVMSTEMADALPFDPAVIPHGVDLDRFAPQEQRAAQRAVGWNPEHRHVLFPYDTAREIKDFPRAEAIVEAANDQLSGTLALQTISGVPHEAVATYMNAADVLILTSKSEGSPNVVKEAMAANLPVVATRVGDVAERLESVEPSVVAEDDRRLARGVAEIAESGERSNGRERVAAELSVDATADRLYEVYQSVVGQSR